MTPDGPVPSSESPDRSETHPLDPALEAILDRYEDDVEAGRDVDIDQLCGELPGREDEVRMAIQAMKATARQMQPAPADRPDSAGGGPDPLLGNSVTSASRMSELKFHARGGLGCVFKAQDEDIGRVVAVKVIGRERQRDQESRERFLREAEVTGRLRHPGIVPVYSRGETVDNRPFYVMPFLDEGTLEEAINEFHKEHHSYRANEPQFRDLLSRYVSACKTIAYAHSRGVVHRDLKPHNVMLGRYGETLVIDWGLAEKSRREHHHRLSGEQSVEVRGSNSASSSSGGYTPQYASPEQMDGTVEIGPASDVYSLGAVLYKLVCGTTPLTATTLGEMRRACLNGDFQPPRERNRSVPWALNAICLRAMQTAPGDRYDSPQDLAADVEAFLGDSPVAAAPERLVNRTARLVRREWPAVLGIMAVLLLLALGALFTAVKQGSLKADARESSRGRLQLAATLAAQAGGGEIDRRWRLLEVEAMSPVIREAAAALNENWDDPTVRASLQAHMTERYVSIRDIADVKLVSLIVQGQDGRFFSRVPKAAIIGENYAYRDYFHGLGEDLSHHAAPPPAEGLVLSTVFISTETERPHVALSVPIRDPEATDGTGEVIGRLTLTMYVGDLGMFDHLGAEETPMLVEARKYDWGDRSSYGVVVHHSDDQTNPELTGKAAAASLPTVDAETLDRIIALSKQHHRKDDGQTTRSLTSFIDPLHGEVTEAAFAPVTVLGRPEEDRSTGWFVILSSRQNADRTGEE